MNGVGPSDLAMLAESDGDRIQSSSSRILFILSSLVSLLAVPDSDREKHPAKSSSGTQSTLLQNSSFELNQDEKLDLKSYFSIHDPQKEIPVLLVDLEREVDVLDEENRGVSNGDKRTENEKSLLLIRDMLHQLRKRLDKMEHQSDLQSYHDRLVNAVPLASPVAPVHHPIVDHEAARRMDDAEASMKRLKNRIGELESIQNELTAELLVTQGENSRLSGDVDKLKSRCEVLESENAEMAKMIPVQKRKEESEQSFLKLSRKTSELHNEMKDRERHIESLESELSRLSDYVDLIRKQEDWLISQVFSLFHPSAVPMDTTASAEFHPLFPTIENLVAAQRSSFTDSNAKLVSSLEKSAVLVQEYRAELDAWQNEVVRLQRANADLQTRTMELDLGTHSRIAALEKDMSEVASKAGDTVFLKSRAEAQQKKVETELNRYSREYLDLKREFDALEATQRQTVLHYEQSRRFVMQLCRGMMCVERILQNPYFSVAEGMDQFKGQEDSLLREIQALSHSSGVPANSGAAPVSGMISWLESHIVQTLSIMHSSSKETLQRNESLFARLSASEEGSVKLKSEVRDLQDELSRSKVALDETRIKLRDYENERRTLGEALRKQEEENRSILSRFEDTSDTARDLSGRTQELERSLNALNEEMLQREKTFREREQSLLKQCAVLERECADAVQRHQADHASWVHEFGLRAITMLEQLQSKQEIIHHAHQALVDSFGSVSQKLIQIEEQLFSLKSESASLETVFVHKLEEVQATSRIELKKAEDELYVTRDQYQESQRLVETEKDKRRRADEDVRILKAAATRFQDRVVHEFSQEIARLENEVDNLKTELRNVSSEYVQVERSLVNEVMAAIQDYHDQCAHQQLEVSASVKTMTVNVTSLHKKYEMLDSQVDGVVVRVQQLSEQESNRVTKSYVIELESEMDEMLRVSQTKNEAFERSLANVERVRDAIDAETIAVADETSKLKKEVSRLQNMVLQMREAHEQLSSQFNQLRQETDEFVRKEEDLRRSAEEETAQTREKFKELQNAKERLEEQIRQNEVARQGMQDRIRELEFEQKQAHARAEAAQMLSEGNNRSDSVNSNSSSTSASNSRSNAQGQRVVEEQVMQKSRQLQQQLLQRSSSTTNLNPSSSLPSSQRTSSSSSTGSVSAVQQGTSSSESADESGAVPPPPSRLQNIVQRRMQQGDLFRVAAAARAQQSSTPASPQRNRSGV
eukprot:ANDGO_01764.mRNA.1 hypothetical protein